MSEQSHSHDLRNRIFFTLFILSVYRFGTFVPIPGIDPVALEQIFKQNVGGILGSNQRRSSDIAGRKGDGVCCPCASNSVNTMRSKCAVLVASTLIQTRNTNLVSARFLLTELNLVGPSTIFRICVRTTIGATIVNCD